MTETADWTVLLAVIGTGIALATLILAQNARINARLDRMDDRVRGVEIAVGKMDQLLAVFDRLRWPDQAPPTPGPQRADSDR